ncbi:MAG TPA: LuxR C-terminal-related transcriptional regulator [Chloroflexota bacterium]
MTASPSETLRRGREAFARQGWAEAYAQLSAADHEGLLEADDLLSLALSSQLTGHEAEVEPALTRAHERFLARGETARAAQSAIWLAMTLHEALEPARAGGWLARAQRLLEEAGLDCVESGWLLLPRARQKLEQGDQAAARLLFEHACVIGQRFGDRDLVAMGSMGVGRCRVYGGEIRDGLAYLDEVMTSIEARQVTANIAGIVYCAVIETCQDVLDVRRAQEWTTSMTRWCASQPELVPYQGVCEVHRAQILQLHGDWPDAFAIAEQIAAKQAGRVGPRAVGPAWYRLGELHRLRGAFAEAENAYRQASRLGYPPEPGLAQMRLAEGQLQAAASNISRTLDEAHDRSRRSRLLPAYVEIMLGVGDIDGAQAGADELETLAADHDVPYLRACAACARGAVLLRRGEPRAALAVLREGCTGWQDLQAPYEAARTRELLGLACRALGDEDRARLEMDAASWTYRQLGAATDLARVSAALGTPRAITAGGLSAREMEVLRLLAAGMTNRAIAADLVLSEKTVARHVSNIFTKLGLTSRSAATAYAYEHQLV